MAAKFQYPFQRIKYLKGRAPDFKKIVVASAGSRLYTFSADDGRRLFVWPHTEESNNQAQPSTTENQEAGDGQEPPEKKRRITPSTEDKNDRTDPNQKSSTQNGKLSVSWSTIPIIAVSPTGRHIVVVTGEDKCVRVFEVGIDGTLVRLSERCMPKRPAALTLTADGNTIISGDKFGDLYALPLLPSDKPSSLLKNPMPAKPFHPAATTLTVHTKRNLAALEQQLKQKSAQSQEKAVPTFERNLLLGHVSMLTDVAFVSLPSGSNSSRDYILTADRDEHIRVSRGPPQAHIIENYCLGHTSFISNICIPQSLPEFLISGGGDNYLLIWDWKAGRILRKVPLQANASKADLVVTGIWEVPLVEHSNIKARDVAVFVALEGSPELLSFILDSSGEMRRQEPLKLWGNLLDLERVGKSSTILVSIDGVHESGSTHTLKDSTSLPQKFVEAYTMMVEQGTLLLKPVSSMLVENINCHGTSDVSVSMDGALTVKEQEALRESLYSSGNLRKRGNQFEET